jgi:hypothetical protein
MLVRKLFVVVLVQVKFVHDAMYDGGEDNAGPHMNTSPAHMPAKILPPSTCGGFTGPYLYGHSGIEKPSPA